MWHADKFAFVSCLPLGQKKLLSMTGIGSIPSHESTLVVHMLESDGEITSTCSKHSEPMSEVLSKCHEKRKKADSGTYRCLMDGERVSPKSENMKTVGDCALECESDGVCCS